ncbi:Thaumatin pathogenesis-related protein [Catenulispora acidiphila DSM 44928]|uniref:Thaumatin pathogenesis-related protein n=1 Tax=Catenulispora acidiphila (strain DSM 44928 / JCM 14897 / NBRC 102108 / NRRL B-24433 / ID139908) TaxID=479433 RepID=C7PXJ5_CATAD|nr:thaumatin family protein [Catenulispora acidiphila]ACU71448.1 Thaumatin pathogenesis-related protein [Catenulispora acidiphila DSM 44928]
MTGHRSGRRAYRPIVAGGLAAAAALALVLWIAGFGSGRSGGGADQAANSTTQLSTSGPASSAQSLPTPSSFATSATTSTRPPPASTTASTPTTSKSKSASTSTTVGASAAKPTTTNPASVTRPAGGHLITVVNADNQTIWAATNPNAQHPIPLTGWRLDPGQSVTFAVPAGWGGRVWGRTGCSFSASGAGHCLSGDCGGVFQCKGAGAPPATLAELTLDSFDGLDFYDVSLVDGSNLPMYINTSHRVGTDPVSQNGCYQGACTKPIVCPGPMQVKAAGQVVACTTPCAAFGGDAYCCRGQWAGRENCDPAKWPVDYAKLVYKDAEPYAYSYAFDDSATMSCKGDCDYRIVFGTSSSK